MEYRLFDIEKDKGLISSFLKSAVDAYATGDKTEEWFNYKFFSSPYGNSILAIAVENEVIVGCIGFGKYKFKYNGNIYLAGLSYSTFVRPDYQGKGIFIKLLNIAEDKCRAEGLSFLLNFPNKNSLPGFLRNNWIALPSPEYYLKIRKPIKSILNFHDLRKNFICDASRQIKTDEKTNQLIIEIFKNDKLNEELLSSSFDEQFLAWRTKFPFHFHQISFHQNNCIVYRTGKRGLLKELQIMAIFGEMNENNIFLLLKTIIKNESPDLVGLLCSKMFPLLKIFRKHLYLKVPNNTNCTFKSFNNELFDEKSFSMLSLRGLDYHML